MLKNTLLMVPQQKTDFKKIFSKKFEKSLIFFQFFSSAGGRPPADEGFFEKMKSIKKRENKINY